MMNTKVCKTCNTEKPVDDFYSSRTKKGTLIWAGDCKKCSNQKRVNRGFNPEVKMRQRDLYHYYRDLIISFLGGKCAHCGYDENLLGLEIDHIDNDGWFQRGGRKGVNVTDLRRIYESGCIGLQVLCGTCHAIKTRTYNMLVRSQSRKQEVLQGR